MEWKAKDLEKMSWQNDLCRWKETDKSLFFLKERTKRKTFSLEMHMLMKAKWENLLLSINDLKLRFSWIFVLSFGSRNPPEFSIAHFTEICRCIHEFDFHRFVYILLWKLLTKETNSNKANVHVYKLIH